MEHCGSVHYITIGDSRLLTVSGLTRSPLYLIGDAASRCGLSRVGYFICMKYRIIILIIIISLGQIFYRILQNITHATRTHAYTHTHTCVCPHAYTHACARMHEHTCTHTAIAAVTVHRTGYRYSSAPSRDRQLRWHSTGRLIHSR